MDRHDRRRLGTDSEGTDCGRPAVPMNTAVTVATAAATAMTTAGDGCDGCGKCSDGCDGCSDACDGCSDGCNRGCDKCCSTDAVTVVKRRLVGT